MTGVNMYICMVDKGESYLDFLRLAESMLAFHSIRVQVESSNPPPPFPYKSDKKRLLCVYLYDPNID